MRGNAEADGISAKRKHQLKEKIPTRAPCNKKDHPFKNDENPSSREVENPSDCILTTALAANEQKGDSVKLIFCAIGIYSAYLVHGSLQEDVFTYRSTTVPSSPSFKSVWFIQVIEAFANTTLAFFCHRISSRGKENIINKKYRVHFFSSGASQVFSKAFTSLSLANGLSFP